MDTSARQRRRALVLAQVGWLLVVVSTVSWRRGVIYAGGVDPVVVVKALITVVAAVTAIAALRFTSARRVSLVPIALVVAAVAVSMIGALMHGNGAPSAALAVRVLVLAVAVVLLAAVAELGRTVVMLLAAMGAVGLIAAATGAIVFAVAPDQYGRLSGGIPGLAPNELAGLLLPVALGLIALLLARGPRLLPLAGLVITVGAVAWTQSRTAIALIVLGAVALVALSGRLTRRTLAFSFAGLVAILAVLLATGVLGNLLLRGRDLERLLTLSARTWVWRAYFEHVDASSWWTGRGLSVQTMVTRDFVHRDYIHAQPFDSSWVSSIAQSGLVGTAVLAVYAIGTLIAVARYRPLRSLWIVLVAAVLVRSLVENGLIGSSPTFVLVLAIASAVWPKLRRRRSFPAVPRIDDQRARTPGLLRS